MPAIEVKGLVKRYGDLAAVDRIDLTCGWGEVFGLLGANGASPVDGGGRRHLSLETVCHRLS